MFRKRAGGVGLHKTLTDQTIFLGAPDVECGVEIFSDFTGGFHMLWCDNFLLFIHFSSLKREYLSYDIV